MPGSSKWSLSLGFPHQYPVYTCNLPHTCYMPRSSHSSRRDHPNKIRRFGKCVQHFSFERTVGGISSKKYLNRNRYLCRCLRTGILLLFSRHVASYFYNYRQTRYVVVIGMVPVLRSVLLSVHFSNRHCFLVVLDGHLFMSFFMVQYTTECVVLKYQSLYLEAIARRENYLSFEILMHLVSVY